MCRKYKTGAAQEFWRINVANIISAASSQCKCSENYPRIEANDRLYLSELVMYVYDIEINAKH